MPTLRLAVLSLLVSSAFLGACTDQEEELSTTEQGITWSTQQFFNCANGCDQQVLGPASNLTCFLAGVTGHLDGVGSVGPHVFIAINSDGNWQLDARYVQQVIVTCISATANRIIGYSLSVDPDKDLGLATAHRRCFLTGGWFLVGSSNPTPHYSDTIRVYQYRGHWFVGAAMTSVEAASMAVCVDVPSFVGDFGFNHDTSGSITGSLVPSHNTNNACGLSLLQGAFGVYPGSAPYPGVRIYQLPDWVWTFDEHVGAVATCVSGTP